MILRRNDMKQNKLGLKNSLSELNDYGCRIERLQSEMRNDVVHDKHLNIGKYLNVLREMLTEHEYNLAAGIAKSHT